MTGNKYFAKRAPCACGGVAHVHDSLAERNRCFVLHQRALAGEIINVERQPRYELTVGGELVAVYVGDFRYDELRDDGRWWPVTEDTKGGQATKTPVYRLKRRLMKVCHGIDIRETS